LKEIKATSLIKQIDETLIIFVDILKDNSWYLKSLQLVTAERRLGRWLAIESEAMVKMYTSFIYKRLNDALRKGKNLSKEFEAMKKVLDDALEKLPVFNQRGNPLLRSTYFTDKEIKRFFKVGKDFIDKGFFSTTYKEEALIRWMRNNPADNVIFKVFGKNGKLIEQAAYKIDEFEVLFKSETTFVVESVEKYFDKKWMREITEIILKEK
jgi:ADP-ribosyltransferase exoenzyme